MKNSTKETLKGLAITVISGVGGFMAVRGIDALYSSSSDQEPPKTVTDNHYPFSKVLAYTLATSVAAGVTKLILRDGLTQKLD